MAAELDRLIEEEIPEGRRHLQDSYANLKRVAEYCEGNYLQAEDKRKALEETKNYTTHSLASVAYQINNLAANFLKLLDLQQDHLVEMESSVNHLAQLVMIHKEKVARREIGVLTANRSATRPPGVKNGIIFPEQVERPLKYVGKPIDYNILDDVGHGIKVQTLNPRTARSASMSSGSSQAPTSKPPTPPAAHAGGTLGRSQGSHYRTPAPPVAPPSVPSHYSPSNYSMGQGSHSQVRRDGSGYAATSAVMSQVHVPPVGMARPISQSSGGGSAQSPSAMHPMPEVQIPPQTLQQGSIVSPPLPPPPGQHLPQQHYHPHFDYSQCAVPPPPPPEFCDQIDDDQPYLMQEEDPYAATGPDLTEPSWTPKIYLEKVVAIYDYTADKSDELSFQENAMIYVIKKNDDGWWEGVLDGVTGLFPGNYVEPCI